MTRPIKVSLLSSMSADVLGAGILTGALRPLGLGFEGHFSLSALESLCDIVLLSELKAE